MTNRLGGVALTLLAGFCLAAPALAAEVVDVRIGTHPTYTRVVFELDAAGGYQIERQLAEDGVPQLLVTMDAGSSPRSMDSRSVMVERVAVQDGVGRAVAHIRLKRKPSRVKELILANPPRLVFDFVYPEAVIAARKAAAEKRAAAAEAKASAKPATLTAAVSEPKATGANAATPKPATTQTPKLAAAPKTAEPRATQPSPAGSRSAAPPKAPASAKLAASAKAPTQANAPSTSEASSSPKAAATAKAPSPAKTTPAAVVAKAPAEVKPQPDARPPTGASASPQEKSAPARVAVKPGPAAPPDPTSAPAAKKMEPGAAAETASAAPVANAGKPEAADPSDSASDVTDAIRKSASGETGQRRAAQSAAAEKKSAAGRAALPAAPAALPEAADIDWTLVGGIAAGGLALFIAFVAWSRRRRLPNDIDVTALAEEADGDSDSGEQEFAMGVEEPSGSDTHFNAPTPAATPQAEPEVAADSGLFDDVFDKESDAMDLENPDLPMERTASEMPTQMGVAMDTPSGGDGDVAGMLREFESRLVKLETQLDEANDARERLERQVTAQAEELRVQRAAIARTQRALRGMNRGEGEQATEPAIREPGA